MAESQWHLEVNGRKVGPFTLDQIQGLYEDGEIRGYHQVTSDQLDGKWISVQELIDSAAIAAPAPPSDATGETPSLSAPVFELESVVLEAPALEAAPALEEIQGEVETIEATQAISLPDLVEAGELPGGQIGSGPALYETKPSAKIFKEPRQDFNADFQPPPRPADVNTSTSAHTTVQSSTHEAPPISGGENPSSTSYPSLEAQSSTSELEQPVIATPAYNPPSDSNDRVAADPALSLLSSLQNLRERQTSQIQHDPTIILHSGSISGSGRKPVPMRMWLTAIFAGIILGALSIGLIKIFHHKPIMGAPGSLTEINQSKPPAQVPPPPGMPQVPGGPQGHAPNGPNGLGSPPGMRPPSFMQHHEIHGPKHAPLPQQGAVAVPANGSLREREAQQPPAEQDNRFEQNQNGYPPNGQPQNQLQPPMDLNNPAGQVNPQGNPQGYPPGDPTINNGTGGNGYPPPPAAPGYPQPGNPGNPVGDPNLGFQPQPPPQGNGDSSQPQPAFQPPPGNGDPSQPQPVPGQDQFPQQPPAAPNIQQ
jgi:hypothetical protein